MKLKQILVGPLLPVPSHIGDAAIALGAVRMLRSRFPGARIIGWSYGSHAWSGPALDGFLRAYEVDEVVHSPSWRSGGIRGIGAIAGKVVAAARGYGIPALARVMGRKVTRLPLGDIGDLVRAITGSDLVVMRGGGYFTSRTIRQDLWLRLEALREVSIARAVGVPYAIWGHTIWELNGPLSKRILWPLIQDSAVTVCREQRSYDYLVSAGAPAQRLAVLPDTAFALRPAPAERVEEILAYEGLDALGAPLIGVNVRPLWDVHADRCELTPRYLGAVAAAMEYMYRYHNAHAVLISHCHSTELDPVPNFQDDRELQRDLAALLGNPEWVHSLKGDYTPEELAGVYGRLRMTVTTRLHLGILSAIAGTPSVLIAYEKNKAHGIADMMGLSRYVVDIDTITAVELLDRVKGLWDERVETAEQMAGRLERIRRELDRYVDLTLAGIGSLRGSDGS
jgi:colanic acid/amylovoran biosynthesis protein